MKAPQLPGFQFPSIAPGRFGPHLCWVYRVLSPLDDVVMKRILNERLGVLICEHPLEIRLILCEQNLSAGIKLKLKLPPRVVPGAAAAIVRTPELWFRPVPFPRASPRPGIAEPKRRQQMKHGSFRAAIHSRNPDQNVIRTGFRVLHIHVEVPVVLKSACVENLKFRVLAAALPVLLE